MAGAGVTDLSFFNGARARVVSRRAGGRRRDPTEHGVDQVVLEALAEEVVENGVGDAMEERKALHDAEREVKHGNRVAGEQVGKQIVHHQQEPHQLVRKPAGHEHQGVHVHQPDVASVLDVRRGADGTGDQDIAGDDDGRRAQKLENKAQDGNGHEPFREVVLGHQIAAGFCPVQQIDVNVLQQGQQEGQQPDADAEQPAPLVVRREAGGPGGPGQGQVSLQGHEGQEERAAVEVDDVDEIGDLAKEVTPQPNVVHGLLHHKEGHGEDHHQVGQAHVDDAKQHAVGRVSPSPVHPQHQAVLGQAHHEQHEVEEEEGDPPTVIVQVEGAVVDEPRRAVVEVV